MLRAASSSWSFFRDAPIDRNLMIYVAGQARSTVIDYEVVERDRGGGGKKLQWIGTTQGDGTVSWASGRLPDVPTYYAPETSHDELCANTEDRRIFRGYVELLMLGRTDQLSPTPPGTGRDQAALPERFVIPDLPVTDDLPDATALRSAGFGGGRRRKVKAPGGTSIGLSLVHGDLAYASHPVVVGHYAGDTIVSAERALDLRLQGALSRRHELGLYPGAVGTHAVFFNEQADRTPAGAVVVGLGQVGTLSAGKLELGVRDALLQQALAAAQRRREAGQTDPHRARYSCLLVGTGANNLNPRDAIEAIVRAALSANRRLEDIHLDAQVLIDRIEFVELFEDVAIGAARDLAAVAAGREFDGRIHIVEPGVIEGPGRRRRGSFGSDAAWDQRLEITQQGDRLRFIFTGDRARAEESMATGQLAWPTASSTMPVPAPAATPRWRPPCSRCCCRWGCARALSKSAASCCCSTRTPPASRGNCSRTAGAAPGARLRSAAAWCGSSRRRATASGPPMPSTRRHWSSATPTSPPTRASPTCRARAARPRPCATC